MKKTVLFASTYLVLGMLVFLMAVGNKVHSLDDRWVGGITCMLIGIMTSFCFLREQEHHHPGYCSLLCGLLCGLPFVASMVIAHPVQLLKLVLLVETCVLLLPVVHGAFNRKWSYSPSLSTLSHRV